MLMAADTALDVRQKMVWCYVTSCRGTFCCHIFSAEKLTILTMLSRIVHAFVYVKKHFNSGLHADFYEIDE